jgi:acyl-CoA synthetase (NDP forming)
MDPRDLIKKNRDAERLFVNEANSKQLLADFGVAVPKYAVTADSARVDLSIRGLSAPYAVKVMSQDILHKSDVGGVALNLSMQTLCVLRSRR